MSRIPVLSFKRPTLLAVAACLLGLLTSCANSPNSKALERSLAADPRLKDNSTIIGDSSQGNAQNQAAVQLPTDFPTEIPRYPGAKLEKIEPKMPATQGQQTSWSSSDPINAIQNFYQKAFESSNWQIVSKPDTDAGGTFVVRQSDLQVTVSIPSGAANSNSSTTSTPLTTPITSSSLTTFDIQYIRNSSTTSQSSEKPDAAKPTESSTPSNVATQPAATTSGQPQDFTDLDKLPEEVRQHIQDLAALGVLSLNKSSGTKSNADATSAQFEPNKTITRRELARWLVAANNRIYANRPGQQIRLPSDTAPAFSDVSRTDPDFQSIQALAETGLISSSLTGDTTAALLRPDVPLTRENLILWKVPLDSRQGLPNASIDTVKQTWGFQDATKIDPKALRAVVADYQNGEQSNIRRVFGYTTLFQPKKSVTRAEAAAALWYFGSQSEGLSAQEALKLKSNPTPSTPSPATSEETPKS